jgi:hypothetical protein
MPHERRHWPETLLRLRRARRGSDPLRHEIETADDQAEKFLRLALDAIRLLNPPDGMSARKVAFELRAGGARYRDDTIRQALARFRSEAKSWV